MRILTTKNPAHAKLMRSSFSTLGEILSRTYAIMQRPGQEKQLLSADLVIVPALTNSTASQFEQVQQIIPVGAAAALAVKDQLPVYATDETTYNAYLARHRHGAAHNVPIDKVVLTGNHRVATRVAEGRVRSKPGIDDLHQVNLDLLHLYGSGEFEQIRYLITPDGTDSNTLEYVMKEKSWGPNYINIGLHLRSDFKQDADWGLIVKFRKTSLNSLGGEWDNELQLGSTLRLESEFYQPLNAAGWLFTAPSFQFHKDYQGIYQNDQSTSRFYFSLGSVF